MSGEMLSQPLLWNMRISSISVIFDENTGSYPEASMKISAAASRIDGVTAYFSSDIYFSSSAIFAFRPFIFPVPSCSLRALIFRAFSER